MNSLEENPNEPRVRTGKMRRRLIKRLIRVSRKNAYRYLDRRNRTQRKGRSKPRAQQQERDVEPA